MKKLLLLLFVAGIFVIGFSACERCATCQYSYEYLESTQVVTFPEECGKKVQINDFKDAKEAEAKMHGTTLECTEN